MEDVIKKAQFVRLVIFDVDGVLTSGNLLYGANGIELKEFHVHDGQGMKYLQQSGVELGVITACKSTMIAKRMQDLGIQHVYQCKSEKLSSYNELKQKLQIPDRHIAYVGDDLPDLPILCRVGLPITVADAPPIMHKHVSYVTKAHGGKGAVREVCDLIMRAQGTYEPLLQSFLQAVLPEEQK